MVKINWWFDVTNKIFLGKNEFSWIYAVCMFMGSRYKFRISGYKSFKPIRTVNVVGFLKVLWVVFLSKHSDWLDNSWNVVKTKFAISCQIWWTIIEYKIIDTHYYIKRKIRKTHFFLTTGCRSRLSNKYRSWSSNSVVLRPVKRVIFRTLLFNLS